MTAVTGDPKLCMPYTAGNTRAYFRPTEKEIRDQRGKTAALVANDGLTPAPGGGAPMVNELANMYKQRPRPRLRQTLALCKEAMYAGRAGAPASRDPNNGEHVKGRNSYFGKASKLPTNTTNLMPQQLQKHTHKGHRGCGAPSALKGKGQGSSMTCPHSDGFLHDLTTPMGLHNRSDVQQYRKLIEMRNQDIMNQREDEVLCQYQHVTQGLMGEQKPRLLTAAGVPKARRNLPQSDRNTGLGGVTPDEVAMHRATQQTTSRGKRGLEVAGAAFHGVQARGDTLSLAKSLQVQRLKVLSAAIREKGNRTRQGRC